MYGVGGGGGAIKGLALMRGAPVDQRYAGICAFKSRLSAPFCTTAKIYERFCTR